MHNWKIDNPKLSTTELEQIAWLIHNNDCYYGNKKHFDNRSINIKKRIAKQLDTEL